jgi:hypothetical protein
VGVIFREFICYEVYHAFGRFEEKKMRRGEGG